MYISKRHQDVEDEFRKLAPSERSTRVYKALCRVAKIRENAVKNRLSALDLFGGVPKDARERSDASDDEEERRPPKRIKPKKARAWQENDERSGKTDEYEDVT